MPLSVTHRASSLMILTLAPRSTGFQISLMIRLNGITKDMIKTHLGP